MPTMLIEYLPEANSISGFILYSFLAYFFIFLFGLLVKIKDKLGQNNMEAEKLSSEINRITS